MPQFSCRDTFLTLMTNSVIIKEGRHFETNDKRDKGDTETRETSETNNFQTTGKSEHNCFHFSIKNKIVFITGLK